MFGGSSDVPCQCCSDEGCCPSVRNAGWFPDTRRLLVYDGLMLGHCEAAGSPAVDDASKSQQCCHSSVGDSKLEQINISFNCCYVYLLVVRRLVVRITVLHLSDMSAELYPQHCVWVANVGSAKPRESIFLCRRKSIRRVNSIPSFQLCSILEQALDNVIVKCSMMSGWKLPSRRSHAIAETKEHVSFPVVQQLRIKLRRPCKRKMYR